jgi:hypothetical protein
MRFRPRYLGVACVALAFPPGAILACSFPDVTFATRSPDGSDDGAPFDASSPRSEAPQPTGDDSGGDAFDASNTSDASHDTGLVDGPDGGPQGDGPSDGPGNEPNCDCGVLGMYPTNAVCGLLGTGLACLSPGGFVGNPACGQAADYATCDFGLGCSTVHSIKVQQCMPSH